MPSPSPERLQDEANDGMTLQVAARGQVEQLQGRVIHVVVEDSASLFQPKADVRLLADPFRAEITLHHRRMDAVGRFRGDLKVHVCLDPDCASELGGSPLVVPFDVTVLPALQLEREFVHIALPFGTTPPVQTVKVTLPRSTQRWLVNPSGRRGRDDLHMTANFTQTTSPDGTGGLLTFDIKPSVSGRHSQSFDVTAVMEMQDGSSRASRKTITFLYDVRPDPQLSHVFMPPAGTYVLSGEALFQNIPNPMLADVASEMLAVEYVFHPEAANGHPLANSWLVTLPGLEIRACTDGPGTGTCLPRGTYVAKVPYRLNFGRDGVVFWPLTLTIR